MTQATAPSRHTRAAALVTLFLLLAVLLAPDSARAGLAELLSGFLDGPVAGWHVAARPGFVP